MSPMRLTPPVHPAWGSISSSALRLAEDLGQRAARLGLSNACGDANEGGEHPLRVCYRMGYASASVRMRREAERETFRLDRRAEMHSGLGHAELHGVGGRRGFPRRLSHRRRLQLALDRMAARRELLGPLDWGCDFLDDGTAVDRRSGAEV